MLRIPLSSFHDIEDFINLKFIRVNHYPYQKCRFQSLFSYPLYSHRQVYARRGRSDSSSSKKQRSKHPRAVCFEKGYMIEPDFDGIASPQTFYLDCCQGWTGYDQTTPWTGTATTDLVALIGCRDELAESENFQECSEKFLVTYPFGLVAYGYDNAFEFATISDAPLGETAFRGEIGVDSGEEKVILSYLLEPYDLPSSMVIYSVESLPVLNISSTVSRLHLAMVL